MRPDAAGLPKDIMQSSGRALSGRYELQFPVSLHLRPDITVQHQLARLQLKTSSAHFTVTWQQSRALPFSFTPRRRVGFPDSSRGRA